MNFATEIPVTVEIGPNLQTILTLVVTGLLSYITLRQRSTDRKVDLVLKENQEQSEELRKNTGLTEAVGRQVMSARVESHADMNRMKETITAPICKVCGGLKYLDTSTVSKKSQKPCPVCCVTPPAENQDDSDDEPRDTEGN